jgi:hypothetical protein
MSFFGNSAPCGNLVKSSSPANKAGVECDERTASDGLPLVHPESEEVILAQQPTLTNSNMLSDLAILAENRLRQSPYCAVRHVVCEHHHDTLILRGRLSTYYLKQVAQETVRWVADMAHVVNAIEVT